ncbi:NAD(+)/NADH kinase [Anaerosinus massiliensis]|uniref:NAD(+)/NADH kinase n=1 Tax=Massilibacillus massiliensis TaxID=1806837 RepID=UPI000ACD13DD|nr:NAD(+)/NADH kinase [Massilibacillus massiliensis]
MFTIGVFPNIHKEDADLVLKRIVEFYATKKVKLLLPQKAADELGYPELGTENLLDEKISIGLTIGGDGTLLNACRKVADRNIPVCGINIGRLGFLADIELTELENKLDKILKNDYRIEERLMIAAIIKREDAMTYVGSAINDIVVTKSGFARMLTLGLSIDDYLVANYQADGLIVSTSTGSTGYSLSAGGPIINPSLKLLLVTPICPHTLNARPMIISQNEEVRINIDASHTDIVLTFDGQDSYHLLPGDEVVVRKSPLVAKIIKFEDKNYYHTMRTKLWKGN